MEPTYAERLTRWLRCKGMRPATLAAKLGVSRATLHAWMHGRSSPRGERLLDICTGLGLSQADFFGELPAEPRTEADDSGEAA